MMNMKPMMSPYDSRPTTTSLLSAKDQGNPSAYAGPTTSQKDVGNKDMGKDMMGAMTRRLEQSVTGKTSNGSAKPDYITSRGY